MADVSLPESRTDNDRPSIRAEFFVFIVIAALIWPVIAVGVVGGYGFLVWMYQLAFGPPGPPGA